MIDPQDIDMYAAEYVLGTLDRDERAQISALCNSNPALKNAIRFWEDKFAPLNDAVADAVPSPALFAAIEKRIADAPKVVRPDFRKQATFWRSMALAACVAAVVLSGVTYNSLSLQAAPKFVAVLQKDSGSPEFVVSLNAKTKMLAVRESGALPAADKSYELWYIADGDKTPHALGVTPVGDVKAVALHNVDPAVISHATLAVSVEPVGGSPTGLPTGPVIITGKFVPADT